MLTVPNEREQERRPLIARRDSVVSDTSTSKDAPLPIVQLVLICLWRATNPLLSEVVLPFLPALLVEQLKVATPATVGYRSGAIQSITSIAICIGIFPGAWLSDAFGRKPVIIAALLCATAAQTFFAFSNSYAQLVVARMLVGFCCSVIPANVKTFAVELSSEQSAPIFFAVMSLGWQGGSMIAPLLGGLLSKPAELLPSVFKGTIFETYPFALPSVVTACVPFLSAIAGIFLARETLPRDKRKAIRHLFARTKHTVQTKRPPTNLFTRATIYILFVFVQMIFLICAFNSIQVLFFYSPRALGGLGLTPREMSFFFMLRPLLLVVYEVLVYPILARKFGPEAILRGCSFGYVMSYGIFFALSYLAKTQISQTYLLGGLIVTIIINVAVNPAFIAADQLIASRASSQQHIAKINAIAELLANLAAGCGLAAGSNMFAYSQEHQLLGGRAAWLFLLVLAITQCISCNLVTKKPGWRENKERRFNPATFRRLSTVSYYTGQ